MIIGGLQKLTLLDYPSHTACTIFLKGCNFRCPFCHNIDLLELKNDNYDIKEDELIIFLEERKGKIEGVCITGGEPLINNIEEIESFIKKIKNMGYLIKIDTNGYFPDKLKYLINKKLVDYVAMDIKSGFNKYMSTCGLNNDNNLIENIKKSIDLIINSNIEYEFRTTLVNGIHDENDFLEIKNMIKGAKKYYLQNYHHVDGMKDLPYTNFLKDEILKFKNIIGDNVNICELRGIDG